MIFNLKNFINLILWKPKCIIFMLLEHNRKKIFALSIYNQHIFLWHKKKKFKITISRIIVTNILRFSLLGSYLNFMSYKLNNLIDKIFEKLAKNKLKKINLKKDEFKKFIFFLMNED